MGNGRPAGEAERRAGAAADAGPASGNFAVPAAAAAAAAAEPRPVLLLGEGNFSFAHAVLSVPGEVLEGYFGFVPSHLVCSSFDGEDELYEKYPEFVPMIRRLREQTHVRVLHGVNAAQLETPGAVDAALAGLLGGDSWSGRFEAVCWNHPHLGTEDCKAHRLLLHHFLFSAAARLRPAGRLIVALVEGQGERWEIEEVATKFDFVLDSCTVFKTGTFPGYECKRNKSGKSFKNTDTRRQWVPGQTSVAASPDMISFVYRFRRRGCARPPLEEGPAPVDERRRGRAPARAEARVEARAEAAAAPGRPHHEDAGPARPEEGWCCAACGKTFRSRQGLQTHTRQVHELKQYDGNRSGEDLWCPLCPRVYSDSQALWQHTICKHADEIDGHSLGQEEAQQQGRAPGGLGGLRLPAPGGASQLLRDRPAWRTGEGAAGAAVDHSPRRCPVEYRGLRVRVWENEGYYACPICGQSAPLDWSIEEHLETLKPLLGLNAECSLCHKRFIEHRALKQHMNYCKRKDRIRLA